MLPMVSISCFSYLSFNGFEHFCGVAFNVEKVQPPLIQVYLNLDFIRRIAFVRLFYWSYIFWYIDFWEGSIFFAFFQPDNLLQQLPNIDFIRLLLYHLHDPRICNLGILLLKFELRSIPGSSIFLITLTRPN